MKYNYERFPTSYGGYFFRLFRTDKELISYISSKEKIIQICQTLFKQTPIKRGKGLE